MSPYSSEDDLPSLGSIIAPRPLMATSTNGSVRRSPRKKTAPAKVGPCSPQKKQRGVPSPVKPIPARPSVKSQSPRNGIRPSKAHSITNAIPSLPRGSSTTETLTTSSNRRSTASPQRSLKLTHVENSLLLPLKVMAMEEHDPKTTVSRLGANMGISHNQHKGSKSIMSLMTEAARQANYQYPQKKKQESNYASRFVLGEARCNDDDESSMDEENEDEDTDLSGFIVDDDAELSYHDSSASESDVDDRRIPARRMPQTAPRRRLQQGSRKQKRVDSGDEENKPARGLIDSLQSMRLDEGADEAKDGEIEVIDLTASPVALPRPDLNMGHTVNSGRIPHVKTSSDLVKPLDAFEAPVKLALPTTKPGLIVPSKSMVPASESSMPGNDEGQYTSTGAAEDGFKTPPATPPPQSPSKLKSPSKLLSPSKPHYVPRSPHRQSMDAFWDHNVINEWNDEYSPKKAPATSPRKKGLARFQIWSDSEQDEDQDMESSDSLPSPSISPRKSRAQSQSPMKSPEKEEKRRLAEEKRLALARKKDFDSRKKQFAIDLMRELDVNVADSQLERLACSTGGVRIIWSKTLRSTAGRANWKRTVTKLSGSPVKGGEVSGPGVKVEHSASIELAEKIVDCEDRLVNTVAHEFCHLTNFMISNVRDQPHGASFKQWAGRVTSHLRKSNVDMWRRVEVTTKHSYVINHKYLWVCVGREKTSAMAFLNIEEDEGCGAEYGRHSKSIDPEKHRCGKCKGRLVQVRPKPRSSPKKPSRSPVKREDSAESVGSSSSAGSDSTSTLGKLIEVVELSD